MATLLENIAMPRISFLLLFLFSFAPANSQSIPLSENAEVSVLTCGTGPEVYALFGHTAIRIHDEKKRIDIVYNYGAFDFGAPNFILRFTKGDLQYFVTSSTFDDFMYQYQYEERSVYEQKLNIPLAKKQQLFDKLNKVLFSNERYYTYKFIDRNCTNMSSDVLNQTLGEKAIYKVRNTDVTYRKTLYPYFNGHFYEQLGTSIIFGTKVDRQATLLFLPTELMESLEVATYQNRPLSGKSKTLLDFNAKETEGSWWNNIYTYLLFLIVVVVANKKPLTVFYFMILGLIGLFFSVAGLYSLHEELAWNYNILLFNPILLAWIYFYFTNDRKWLYRISVFLLCCVAIYLIIVLNKAYLLIILPMIAANIILLGRIVLKYKKAKNQLLPPVK